MPAPSELWDDFDASLARRKPSQFPQSINPDLIVALSLIEGAGPPLNLTDGRILVAAGTSPWIVTSEGVAIDGTSSRSWALPDTPNIRCNGSGFTILYIGNAASNSGFVLSKGTFSGNYDYGLYRNSAGNVSVFWGANHSATPSPALAWSSGIHYVAVAVDASGVSGFMDGSFASAAGSAVGSSTANFSLGHLDGNSFFSSPQVVQALVVGRKLSNAEILQWYIDPWGFLAGRYTDHDNEVAVAAGGNHFNKTLTATFTASGSLVRRVGKILTAARAVSGNLVRQVRKILTGTRSVTGSLVRKVGKKLSGSVTWNATETSRKVKLLTLTATRSVSGTLTKLPKKLLSASRTLSGSLKRQVGKKLAASTTRSAALVRQVHKTLTAAASRTATMVKVRAKTLTATRTMSGTLRKLPQKLLTANASLSASLAQAITHNVHWVKAGASSATWAVQSAASSIWTKVASGASSIWSRVL